MRRGGWVVLGVLAACGGTTEASKETTKIINDPCAEGICPDHSVCVAQGDVAVCSCAAGFHAASEGSCVSDDPCTGVTCSDHGTCMVSDQGIVQCRCDEGYQAQNLACMPVPFLEITVGGGAQAEVTRVGLQVVVQAPVPTAFTASMKISALQRAVSALRSKDELLASCADALNPIDAITPPRYAIDSLLINPLSQSIIQNAFATGGEPVQVSNPLVVDSVVSSESSLQVQIDSEVSAGFGSAGALALPKGSYSWAFLCRAAAADGATPFLTLEIHGHVGNDPYGGMVSVSVLDVD